MGPAGMRKRGFGASPCLTTNNKSQPGPKHTPSPWPMGEPANWGQSPVPDTVAKAKITGWADPPSQAGTPDGQPPAPCQDGYWSGFFCDPWVHATHSHQRWCLLVLPFGGSGESVAGPGAIRCSAIGNGPACGGKPTGPSHHPINPPLGTGPWRSQSHPVCHG